MAIRFGIMTKAQLLVDVKNLLGPGVDVGDVGLTTWINEAYLKMCDEIQKENPDYFTKLEVTDSITGQQEYALPSDCEQVKMVTIKTGGQWYRVSPLLTMNQVPVLPDSANYGISTASPFYYVYGTTIGFLPIPAESTVGAIKMWYTYSPSDLIADSDVPVIPSKYHHAIKFSVGANFFDRDGNNGTATNMRNYFSSEMNRMVASLDKLEIDSSPRIITTQDNDLFY